MSGDHDIPLLREHVAEFIETHLINPETGRPFVLIDAEREFIKHAFALGLDGRLLYPTLLYAAIKKSGKTGFAAMLVLTMLLLFGGRYAEGYCVANDLEQSRGRVFEAIKRIVQSSPLLASEADIIQNKITFDATGSTITAVPSDYTGAAGVNPVISVFDELWGFTSEKAWRLWDEFVPSPARRISCRLVVTHAGFSGESTLLEDLYLRGLSLPQVGTDLHAGKGMLCFWSHVPIAPWQTEAWVEEMRSTLRPHQYLRMVENKFTSNVESFVNLDDWDSCCTGRPIAADTSMSAWAAVDASTKRDSTAITTCAWDRTSKRVRLIHHRIFTPSKGNPIHFEDDVEATILDLAQRFHLREVRFDPWQMQASSQRLIKAGINMVEFPQTPANLTAASQNLFELIKGNNISVYEDAEIRLAVSRAVAHDGPRGWRIDKTKTSHHIDVVVSLAMAAYAATKKGEAGWLRQGFYLPYASLGDTRRGNTWHEPREPTRVRYVNVNEMGKEITADEARAIRNTIPAQRKEQT